MSIKNHGSSRGDWFLPIGLTCTILAVFAVVVRFYTRAFLTRSLGSDDLAIIPPFVSGRPHDLCALHSLKLQTISATAGQVFDSIMVVKGFGVHEKYLSTDERQVVKK